MTMSRDGLLPKAFAKVHPKYQTPWFATLVTGVLVAIPALFVQSNFMTNLTSIGTLFAFVLVSGGVLLLPRLAKEPGKFRLPYINGRYIVPIMFAGFIYLFRTRTSMAFENVASGNQQEILFLIFLVLGAVISVLTLIRSYSLIPILGVLFCSYLMIEIPTESWIAFFGWMGLGLMIYFAYGYRKSLLAKS
jgi:basic amino acid/polyamine antiporter, APA family